MTGLTTLVQFRILRDGGDHLEFSNDLVRAHAYYAVPAPMRRLLHRLIADVLLVRAAEGDDSLGLEIAWHCMRCGRKEEGTEHLLLGARASIKRGAVHEAERRLGSSLDSLTGPALSEARLLVVELLQEQGRFTESMTLLSTFPEERLTESGRCFEDLAASLTMTLTRSHRLDIAARAKGYFADHRLPPQTRLRALRLAGHIASCLDSRSIACELVAEALEAPHINFTEDEELEWDTQVVYLTHFTHQLLSQSEETFRRLRDIAVRANARSAANGRSYRILFGLALCHRRAGRYAAAIEEFKSALTVVDRLGRDTSFGTVYGSLSACHREIGDLDGQRIYAELCLQTGPSDDYFSFYSAFCAADAYQRMGDLRRAEHLMDTFDSRITSETAAHLKQMWLTCMADHAWTAGRARLACELGTRVVTAPTHGQLHRRNVSGMARWLAVLSEAGYWEDRFDGIVEDVSRLQAASWWDEAERLCALKRLAGRLVLPFDVERTLANALAQLPRTIDQHLSRYGIALE